MDILTFPYIIPKNQKPHETHRINHRYSEFAVKKGKENDMARKFRFPLLWLYSLSENLRLKSDVLDLNLWWSEHPARHSFKDETIRMVPKNKSYEISKVETFFLDFI